MMDRSNNIVNRNPISVGDVSLPERDIDVLRLAAMGKTNKEIAELLSLSLRTINKMLGTSDARRAIYAKLRVRNRAEATAWYVLRFGPPSISHNARHNGEKPGGSVYAPQSDVLALSPLATTTELQTQDFVQLFTDYLETLEQVRIEGNPLLVVERAPDIYRRLRKVETRIGPSNSAQSLLRIGGLILVEEALALSVTTVPPELVGTVKRTAGEVRVVAKECNDEELFGLAYLLIGEAYYGSGNYAEALRYETQALPRLRRIDNRLSALRTQALCWAFLGYREDAEVAKARAEELIEEGQSLSPGHTCAVLEGLGRAMALLRKPEGFDLLQQAWHIYAQGEMLNQRAPLPHIQLARGTLEVALTLEATDKEFLKRAHMVREEASNLAEQFPWYRRHIELLHKLDRALSN